MGAAYASCQIAGDEGSEMTSILCDTDTVKLGSRVRVQFSDGEEEYTIVGGEEADAISRRISSESPLALALLGHAAGEQVKVRAPGGLRAVTILDVSSIY
jgi:transcription elongation factor GreA